MVSEGEERSDRNEPKDTENNRVRQVINMIFFFFKVKEIRRQVRS